MIGFIKNFYNMDKFIENALDKAAYLRAGETGITGAPLKEGMVLMIEYHTSGRANICDDCKTVTHEQFDWAVHGCSNNTEWHRYLNRSLWRDYSSGLKEVEA